MDFMEPVDTAVLQVPNYYNIIKRPMDVGTIIKRVQNKYYHRVDNLISDFRLVISNCFTFNRPGDVVYRNCQKLEKFFHRVLNKMPKGEEKPSTKDPHASGKQQSLEKTNEVSQRLCREMMRKLHAAISREDDKSICKYFNAKLDLLSQKVDRYNFKTIEEFHFEVNSIFKKFDTQVKMFYEAYHKACDHDPNNTCDKCIVEGDAEDTDEQAESGITLDKEDITDVLIALRKAENCVDLCMKAYTREKENRAKDLINTFTAAADQLKLKLNLKHKDHGTSQIETEEAEQEAEEDTGEETDEESDEGTEEDSEQETGEEEQVEEQEEEQEEEEYEEEEAEDHGGEEHEEQVQEVQQDQEQCYENNLMDEEEQQPEQQSMNENYDGEYCEQPQANDNDAMPNYGNYQEDTQDNPAYFMDPPYYNSQEYDVLADQQLDADIAIEPEPETGLDPSVPPESTLWSDLQLSSSSDDSDKDEISQNL